MSAIQNYIIYNERMEAGIKDKLWFVDNLLPEIDTVVDFGCADCALGRALNYYYPNRFRYIGIDDNDYMRELGAKAGFVVVEDIVDLDLLNIDFNRTVMVFSSVIHEIAHYCGYRVIEAIFREVRAKKCSPKQIAIRDMCRVIDETATLNRLQYNSAEAAINDSDFKSLYDDFVETCKRQNREDYEFWSIEFFLKYSYRENWEREKEERYLWNWDPIIFHILNPKYSEDCNYTFTIPYQVRKIREDFNYNLTKHTHRKVLYTRKED